MEDVKLFAEARNMVCPTCDAEPEKPCVTTADHPGKVMAVMHTARYRAAWEARK